MNHSENKHVHAHEHTHELHGAGYENKCRSGKHFKSFAKLCPLSLGIASGLVNGVSILIFSWLNTAGHMHIELARTLGVSGIWAGALFGFIAGFVGAALLALIYNACLCCWKCKSKCSRCGSHCCKCNK